MSTVVIAVGVVVGSVAILYVFWIAESLRRRAVRDYAASAAMRYEAGKSTDRLVGQRRGRTVVIEYGVVYLQSDPSHLDHGGVRRGRPRREATCRLPTPTERFLVARPFLLDAVHNPPPQAVASETGNSTFDGAFWVLSEGGEPPVWLDADMRQRLVASPVREVRGGEDGLSVSVPAEPFSRQAVDLGLDMLIDLAEHLEQLPSPSADGD